MYMFPCMRIRPVPNVLDRVCKDLGISRDELSRRIGVSTTTCYRVDSGQVDPSPRFIAALMNLTGEKFERLFEIDVAA